jgi:hypothetical protein
MFPNHSRTPRVIPLAQGLAPIRGQPAPAEVHVVIPGQSDSVRKNYRRNTYPNFLFRPPAGGRCPEPNVVLGHRQTAHDDTQVVPEPLRHFRPPPQLHGPLDAGPECDWRGCQAVAEASCATTWLLDRRACTKTLALPRWRSVSESARRFGVDPPDRADALQPEYPGQRGITPAFGYGTFRLCRIGACEALSTEWAARRIVWRTFDSPGTRNRLRHVYACY